MNGTDSLLDSQTNGIVWWVGLLHTPSSWKTLRCTYITINGSMG